MARHQVDTGRFSFHVSRFSKKEGPLSQFRQIQLLAIILILLAGYLWSHRLSEQYLLKTQEQINNSLTDQIAQVQNKIADKNDPYELTNIGRKFLGAGNPRFAILVLQKATQLAPKYRDAWYLLGYSYLDLANKTTDPAHLSEKQDDLNQAISALHSAHAIDPNLTAVNDLLSQLQTSPTTQQASPNTEITISPPSDIPSVNPSIDPLATGTP